MQTMTRPRTETRHGQRTLLDTVIPDTRFADTIEVEVDAPAEAIFRALHEVTLQDMPIAGFFGSLRYLPGKLLGRGPSAPSASQSFFEGLRQQGTVVLAEDPGCELVVGSIGKYHQVVDQEPLLLTERDQFFEFQDPEYQRLAMSIRVEPSETPGCNLLLLEHRTQPLSPDSARRFAHYWLVIKPMGAFVSRQLLLAIKRRAERCAA
jgi:hypothetical protein